MILCHERGQMTEGTDDFKKHFAYICAYTYAWKVIKPLSHLSPLFLINIELQVLSMALTKSK